MIRRTFRLKQPALFAKTLQSGLLIGQSAYFKVICLHRLFESDTPSRFGLIISKKVAKRAVDRNRWKRRMRHILYDLVIKPEMKTFQSFVAIIVIARKPAVETSFSQLRSAMQFLIRTYQAKAVTRR